MPARTLELLRSMDLFAELADEELARITRLLKERKISENERIFVEGDTGDGMYVILQGRVRVATTDTLGRERVLAFYGPGEFFGDLELLTGQPRSASATASTSVRLLQLRKDDFDVLMATNVGIMRAMLRVTVERQTMMDTRLTQEANLTQGDVRGHVTVVFSPRGGAGQTVVATNLAVGLAQLTPDRVVILDLDLLFGHVAMLLDLVPRTDLAATTPAAIRSFDADSLAHYLSRHAESSLRVVCGTMHPEQSELITGDHVRAIVELLRRQYVHVVIDAGSRFSDPCLTAMELADRVILLSTPEPSSARAIQESERVLRELLGVSAERIRLVENQPNPYGETSRADLATSRGVAHIPFGGEDVSRACLKGVPLVISNASNPTSRAILALAREVAAAGSELAALSGAR